MISVVFFNDNGSLRGFRLSGHAGFAESGRDIVCAAVSSAAYLTANTVTDVAGIPADVTEKDGLLELKVAPQDAATVGVVLNGFRLHMKQLAEQYPQQITITEV